MKATRLQLITLTASLLLLLVCLLMPLVALMSYRWGLWEVLAKIPRLVHSGVVQVVGYVLLALMVLSPLLLALRPGVCCSWRRSAKHRGLCPLWAGVVRLLPLVSSLLLIVALLSSSKPISPAVGLWVYCALALLVAALPAVLPEKEND